MIGVRMSALPTSRYCGQAALLDRGAGRAAALSTAWHAACANVPGSAALLAALTDEEAETVLGWNRPKIVDLPPGCDPPSLDYDSAETELTVTFDELGRNVTTEDPLCLSVGHIDMGWVVKMPDGARVAYIGDLKKTEFTATEGVESLQLVAYGFAYAARRDCDFFCLGIWAATENRWTWGEPVDLESAQAAKLWERVVAAAKNKGGEFARGPHCRGCWSRFQCPAYILPPEVATGSLAILDGETAITADRVASLVQDIARAEDTIKVAKEFAKDWEAQHPGQVTADGKVWRPIQMPGRESIDRAALLKAIPEASKFVKQGKGYEMHKWVASK